MTEEAGIAIGDGIATITLDNPPVNALGAGLRGALMTALGAALHDPGVQVIVLTAAGRTWPAGADIREFGRPPEAPSLPELCQAVAGSAKPVIAALHGMVLGGGLELALAARVRLAEPGTELGLPEVTLGILPGAGGTQRLPRLIGAKRALGLMLSGLPIGAARAEELGLVDAVTEGGSAAAAERLARAYLAGEAELPEVEEQRRRVDPGAWLLAVAAARSGLGDPQLPAPGRIIDCVEAALLLPEDEGFAFERAAFEDLVATSEAAALRHAFLAERRAAKQPDLAHVKPREIHNVGVVGGGLMGAGIATALLGAGCSVTLVERDGEALAAGLARVATHHERAVAKGRLSPEAREAEWARLAGATGLAALAGSDLVIEAAYEDEAVKAGIFAELDRVARPGAVLATNTSYLDVNRIAAATARPGDVIGLHFFSPVQAMRLVEVVVGAETAPDVIASAFALARRIGKVAVRAGVCDGFIGNRILTAYRTAADFLLEDGASPYEIDRAMVAWGFPAGPYQVLDMAGLDISWARRRRLAATRDPARRYVAIGDRLCEAGRLGRKAGKGYYLYPERAWQGVEDPDVLALIAAEREARGIVAREVTAAEIQDRVLAAMANEGARILEEGIAARPSDIDLVMLLGYGFPRWRGGPMLAADQAGLLALRKRLVDYAREEEAFWRPAALWEELIKNGRKFADLND
ncbi:3-hydroxyacyl-CoA dehydrogenase NAD-binding domain-containing protein [Defluviimonas sp. WL0024]|uniref:3-hydroxyacyl-CoA dehydrogenase NAD-binding domain-containing protein n=1 Tax=Albidovulum salinarum TaxID=2984153 RepID=A0ABT2WZ72_9RHOB|nr:3-hydroxyacyl-CoA dehydrogenase NAD-binding domain-containing protein [Defluviimonas sp. WL0024]MCU9846963.1 3-hydroxyacyl-CoA dehydrogenase NAD-binding domain-containing protein [Defluviimonas sp. WL0024]